MNYLNNNEMDTETIKNYSPQKTYIESNPNSPTMDEEKFTAGTRSEATKDEDIFSRPKRKSYSFPELIELLTKHKNVGRE